MSIRCIGPQPMRQMGVLSTQNSQAAFLCEV
jgi:hypothetical protein